MKVVHAANLGIRFLLELSLLAVFCYWGLGAASPMPFKILLGLGIPAIIALIWGKLLAPASTSRLQAPWLLIVEVALFGLALAALYTRGHASSASALGLVYLLNRILLSVWRQ